MLNVQGLFFGYKNESILEDVAIQLNKGEVLSIVGPNGTGKTTLLKCIVGVARPKLGTISIDGKNTDQMTRRDLARCISYVPQSAPSKFPVTVFDAVLMGRRPYITWKPSKKDLEIVAAIIASMNLQDVALRDFDQLSGGQKQKVLLARAVAQETDYLLLDEPTSNLDLRHQIEVMEMISNMVMANGVAAILAMHDLNLASRFSHRMVMLNGGRLFCDGKPEQVMTEENIKIVYGVEARVSLNGGYPFVLPTRKANRKG
jgi:iron complex transport system ATP-binding protein